MARHVELDAGDELLVGATRIAVVHKAGRRTRVKIEAPQDVEITHIRQDGRNKAPDAAPEPKDSAA